MRTEIEKDCNELSLKSVRIEILAENTGAHLSWASGSFFRTKNQIFLVTNRHVLSGRNFQTNQTLHHSGAIPGSIKIIFHSINSLNANLFSHDEGEISFDLFKPDQIISDKYEIPSPRYFIHPQYGSKVDVAVINLTEIFSKHPEVQILAFEMEIELRNKPILRVMDNVFVVGFPLNTNTTPNKYPIYKNATIASEPDAYDEIPLFYIDGKTKSGMSGFTSCEKK